MFASSQYTSIDISLYPTGIIRAFCASSTGQLVALITQVKYNSWSVSIQLITSVKLLFTCSMRFLISHKDLIFICFRMH